MKNFVVFDLDGTLLNTLPDIAGAMNRVLFRFGLPQHSEESYKMFTGNGARVLTQRALEGREEFFEHVYNTYLREYALNSRVDTRPYAGVTEALEELVKRGIAVLVFSNKDDPEAKDVVKHYFPGIPFAAVRGSLPEVPLKPDPAGLLNDLENLGLSPEQGLYVGDTVTDIQTAKAAGIPGVAVLWGFQPESLLREQAPEETIHEPRELLALAEKYFTGREE